VGNLRTAVYAALGEELGIGDFGDLRAMLPEIARRGGAFIGLNPIHALYPANPESASPYSLFAPLAQRYLY
jgi:4-alpha-glucanotransferase